MFRRSQKRLSLQDRFLQAPVILGLMVIITGMAAVMYIETVTGHGLALDIPGIAAHGHAAQEATIGGAATGGKFYLIVR